MIKITVRLQNEFSNIYEEIEISIEELKQLACNKAKGQYPENYYTKISAVDIEIKNKVEL